MRYRDIAAAGVLLSAIVAGHASACIIQEPDNPNAIRSADVAVVGRITNYRIVQNPEYGFFDRLGGYIGLGRKTFPGDYGRFDILVDQVLVGKAPRTLTATWAQGNFAGIPNSESGGPYLIALRKSGSPEPGTLTVMQGVCSPAFVYPATQDTIRRMQDILAGKPAPAAKPAGPRVISPVWGDPPLEGHIKDLYPQRAFQDEVEGMATIECSATSAGRLESCKAIVDNPPGYDFAQATVKWVQAGRLKAGTYKPGDTVLITRRWKLDE